MRLLENLLFLRNLVSANNRQFKKIIKDANTEELKTLVECVLNFEKLQVKSKNELDKQFATLLTTDYTNLLKARKTLLKNQVDLCHLVEIILTAFLEEVLMECPSDG